VKTGLIDEETFKTKYPEATRDFPSVQDKHQLTFALEKDVKDFELPMVEEGAAEIEVKSPYGKPVKDADVIISPDDGFFSWWRNDSATVLLEGSTAYEKFLPWNAYASRTDSAGIARIKNLPAGKQSFRIEHDTFIQNFGGEAIRSIHIESGVTSKLTVQLDEKRSESASKKTPLKRAGQFDIKAFELHAVADKKSPTTKEYVLKRKDSEPETVQLESEVVMDGTSVESAAVSYGQDGYEVVIQFTKQSAERFEETTTRYLDKRIGILVFDELLSAPIIKGVLSGGNLTIYGGMTEESAKTLVEKFNQPAKKAD